MAEKLKIQAVSDLIISKSGREYFTLQDFEHKRYVCFNAQLKDYCKLGTEIEAELTPGKTPEDSPRLDMIYVNGKPVVQPKPKEAGRSYGKSKEELTQIKQLEEAKRRSIEVQTALNRAVDLAVADKIAFFDIVECAELFYSYMVGDLVIESEKVMEFYLKKGAKIEEKQSDTQIEPDKKATVAQVPPKEETERSTGITNAGELMKWVASHGKKYTPSWVRQQANLGANEIITDETAIQIYKDLKVLADWD